MKGDPCDPHLLEEGRGRGGEGWGGEGTEIGVASPPPLGLTRLRSRPHSLFLADDGNSDGYGSDDDDDANDGGDDDDGGDRTKKRVT